MELIKNNPIKYSFHKPSNILNINRSTATRWFQNDLQFQMVENSRKNNFLVQVKKSCFDEHEDELIKYFYQLLSLNLLLISTYLFKKCMLLNQN